MLLCSYAVTGQLEILFTGFQDACCSFQVRMLKVANLRIGVNNALPLCQHGVCDRAM